MKKQIALLSVLGVAAMLVLPGCDFGGGRRKDPDAKEYASAATDESDGPVLVYVAGSPAVRMGEFHKRMAQTFNAYPHLKNLLQTSQIPLGFKKKLAEQLANQAVIEQWSYKQNIDQDAEFQKTLANAYTELKRLLMAQHFEKGLLANIETNDSELRSEYEKNKTRYVKAQGGVVASGVSFSSQDSARTFLTKVRGKLSQFAKLGDTESAGTFTDFATVSENSFGVPESIKKVALKARAFPSVELVSADSKYWVVNFAEKKTTEYLDFDEIKSQIEAMLKTQKFQDVFAKRMDELKKDFPIEVKEELLLDEQTQAEAKPQQVPVAQAA